MRVGVEPTGIYLELSRKHGNGLYSTENGVRVQAICDVLRMDRREILPLYGRKAREGIPAEVRREVWQRDGGRCCECGRCEDLQFDHIIPIALGGSNDAINIQLLRGLCNRKKGARI